MTVMDEWLTTTEVVREFKISERTVRRAVKEQKLRPARTSIAPNAKMLFRRTDIERWLGIGSVDQRDALEAGQA